MWILHLGLWFHCNNMISSPCQRVVVFALSWWLSQFTLTMITRLLLYQAQWIGQVPVIKRRANVEQQEWHVLWLSASLACIHRITNCICLGAQYKWPNQVDTYWQNCINKGWFKVHRFQTFHQTVMSLKCMTSAICFLAVTSLPVFYQLQYMGW